MKSSVVDFHTHILPCMDDGSRSVERSLEMLRMECEQGINGVVLTPHFYADNESPQQFFKRRDDSQKMLTSALESVEVLPKLTVGAEVHYFEGISDCEYLSSFAVGDTGCVLIELPMRHWDDRMLQEIASIKPKRHITPVIAHIDRYLPTFKAEAVFERVLQLPLMVQVNASFFIKRSTRRLALRMLDQGKIHFIGSDCHNITERAPNLGVALEIIERRLGSSAIEFINSNEKQINL